MLVQELAKLKYNAFLLVQDFGHYSSLSNKRNAIISVTPDKFSKIIKRNETKNPIISVTQDMSKNLYFS